MSIYESLLRLLQLLVGWSQRSLSKFLPEDTAEDKLASVLRYLWVKLGQLEVFLAKSLSFILTLLFVWFLYLLLKKLVKTLARPFLRDFFSKFSDLSQLGEEEDLHAFINKFSRLLATVCIYLPAGLFFPKAGKIFSNLCTAWESLIIWQVVAVLSFLLSILYYLPALRSLQVNIPIRGILKAASTVVYSLGLVLVFLHLAHLNLSGFLAGMGALSAVVLLVFQDVLLNLIATFKIYNNHMLKVGDWIEAPSFNCNGVVKEVNLGLIKVENFDMSISSFSPKGLLASTFKNWSNMQEIGARLAQQTIWIGLSSVRLMRQADLTHLSEASVLKSFWQAKGQALTHAYAQELVNLKLFREYLLYYLKGHPAVHTQMAMGVYTQKMGETNLVLQLSFYSRETECQAFEDLQAQVLTHAYSLAPLFDLETRLNLGREGYSQIN